jgi:hypothetical protein
MLVEREPILNRDRNSDILSSETNKAEGAKTAISIVFGHVKLAKIEKTR